MVDEKDGRTGGCAFRGSVFLPLFISFKPRFIYSVSGSDVEY